MKNFDVSKIYPASFNLKVRIAANIPYRKFTQDALQVIKQGDFVYNKKWNCISVVRQRKNGELYTNVVGYKMVENIDSENFLKVIGVE